MAVPDYLPEWEDFWIGSGYDPLAFFHRLLALGYIDQETHDREIEYYTGPTVPEPVLKMPLPAEAEMAEEAAMRGVPIEVVKRDYGMKAEVYQALMEKERGYLANAFYEVLKSLWKWTLEKMKALIELVIGVLRPPLERAWEFAKAKLEDAGRVMYDQTMKLFEGHSPIKPEEAPALAVKLYMLAMGAGMGAHGVATVTELLHPLKRIGLHQTAAILGDFAGFGRISGATIGPLVSRVLGQNMTYMVQDRFRPRIPDERLLIEFRSKREIDKAQFDESMGYQGFSKEWGDVIERWQWKDPRMFELMRVADIGIEQGPPPASEMWWFRKFGITGDKLKDWWLYRKLMRAGYEDVDLDILVRTIHRREISFAMTYVRTAIRRNYRWGYLTDEELMKWIDKLMLPEQAKEWIGWAGQLDRDYFYKQDLVMYYKTAFRNDVIDDDDLLVSLIAMGMPAKESDIIVRTEKVKKRPAVTRKVAAEVKKPLSDIQKKYVTLYIQQYRKDLITSERLLESLLAIGLAPDLAEVSAAIEAAKKGSLLAS